MTTTKVPDNEEYFANFIKTGDPNGSKLPKWPAASSDKSVPVVNIDVESRVETEKHRERYESLDSLKRLVGGPNRARCG